MAASTKDDQDKKEESLKRTRQPRSTRKKMEEGEKLKEQDIIGRILEDGIYDWRVRPRGTNTSWPDTGGPVLVTVNIYLRSISKIDDVNMEYSAQFTFREEWGDPRLAYKKFDTEDRLPPFVVLATSEKGTDQQIWMPDTFFQNEKEARRHLIDKPNVLIRIYPDGSILYSVRLTLTLSCPMFLHFYPLDRQQCLIDLASYAYTTDDIKYEWKEKRPIQLKAGLEQSLPSFELQKVETDYCTSKTNTGEYSCLRTKMILRREFSYYLLQLYIPSFMLVIVSWVSFWLDKDSVPARVTLGEYSCVRVKLQLQRAYSYYLIQLYIPSFMLVVVSWVSFWLDKDAVPARVSLGVTTLLTMTTQASGINAKLPPVSYTKAVDVWIGVCLAFIFGALLEFALVNYAGRMEFFEKETQSKKRQQQQAQKANESVNLVLSVPSNPLLNASSTLAFTPSATTDIQNRIHAPQAPFHPQSMQQTHLGCPQCESEMQQLQGHGEPSYDSHLSARPLMSGQLDFSQPPMRLFKKARERRRFTCFQACCTKYKERSKRIDVISRIAFPVGFFFFNFDAPTPHDDP